MLQSRSIVIEVADSLVQMVKEVDPPETTLAKLVALKENAKERELVIPIVGAFSAGKSSLINHFCGDSRLPTAITPETSLATEIHYSPDEHIIGVKADGGEQQFGVDEMAQLKERAAEFSYVKLYTRSEKVKAAEPLVLVDMPGFDSPLDAHNKAIMAYLERGSHYVVLSSVEEGTISRSLLRRLEEIHHYGRGFSFFLSKKDLRAPSVVAELVQHYSEQLKNTLYIDHPVHPIGKQDNLAFDQLLNTLNPEALFLAIYKDPLKEYCYELLEAINLRISTLQKDASLGAEAVKEMERSLEALGRKAEGMIKEIESRYSKTMVNDLVDVVGQELNGSLDELASVGASGNQDNLSLRINDIVQHALLLAIKDKFGALNKQILGDFKMELAGLDQVIGDLSGQSDFSELLSTKLKDSFDKLDKIGGVFQEMAKKEESDKRKAALYKGVVSVVAISTTVIAPILEIVLLFLPDIIRFFTNGADNKKAQIRQKLETEIIPEIRRKLRTELPPVLNEQVINMVTAARCQFEESLNQQKTEIIKGLEEKKQSEASAQTKLACYQNVRDQLTAKAEQIMGMV